MCHVLDTSCHAEKTYKDKKTLQTVKINEEINILPEDKANTILVMNTGNYDQKIRDLLNYPA